ncbi:hypothetical protein KP509_12G033800 [Ceratopteris richardii]|uniref:Secreted protein n=1 Tax=Ceratopteris richardii TaxID=49495 RepID=A0A8T2TNG8_CERRI|nr:hypothetical protein KP509_12G033800 [Ceratopteris richardii]
MIVLTVARVALSLRSIGAALVDYSTSHWLFGLLSPWPRHRFVPHGLAHRPCSGPWRSYASPKHYW